MQEQFFYAWLKNKTPCRIEINTVNISSKLEQHIEWIESYKSLGFSKILLHNVNRNQKQFIHDFATILSQLR